MCNSKIYRIIPNLYFPQDNSKESTLVNKAIQDKNHLLEMLEDVCVDSNQSKNVFLQSIPFPFCVIDEPSPLDLKDSLSRIICTLHKSLLTTTSKQLIVSCLIANFFGLIIIPFSLAALKL